MKLILSILIGALGALCCYLAGALGTTETREVLYTILRWVLSIGGVSIVSTVLLAVLFIIFDILKEVRDDY